MSLTLMNSNNRITESNNRTKATAAVPMAGAVVTTALLLSGLFLIGSYQPAIAQQNMTECNATMGGGGNVTNATTAEARNTTIGGPTAGEGEGSGGGAARGEGTTASQ